MFLNFISCFLCEPWLWQCFIDTGCFLQYYRFSVGGMTDVAEIKGHRSESHVIENNNNNDDNNGAEKAVV